MGREENEEFHLGGGGGGEKCREERRIKQKGQSVGINIKSKLR